MIMTVQEYKITRYIEIVDNMPVQVAYLDLNNEHIAKFSNLENGDKFAKFLFNLTQNNENCSMSIANLENLKML